MALTVGQIGVSTEVAWHLRAYVDAPQVDSVVLADPDEQARSRLHDRFGIIKQLNDGPQALLDNPDISVIDICAPVALRAPLAVASLEAGKHVICASPPAGSLEEFDAMVAAAQRTGRRLLAAIPECMVPANQKAQQLLADGELGQVLLATALVVGSTQTQQDSPAAPWTDLGALTFGSIAVLQRWLGVATAVSMTAAGEAGDTVDGEQHSLLMNLEMCEGALAQIAATVASTEPRPTAERRIVGTAAQLLVRDDPEDEVPLIGMEGHMFYPIAVHNPPYVMQYATRRLLGHFIECIADQHEPQVTLEETRAALRALLAGVDSHGSGQRIALG